MQYKYLIKFEDGLEKTVDIRLNPATLDMAGAPATHPPEWTRLGFCQCPVCPYSASTLPYCPVAVNLSEVTYMFSNKASTMIVDARVISDQREYAKHTSLQVALSSIIGIYMVSSGCRMMEMLKPMVRHHLPFASLEETVFRSVSSYLMTQYLRAKKGLEPDWKLEKLGLAYKDIEIVNLAMTNRIRKASEKDANYNAVIILDAFAKMVPWSVEQGLPEKGFPLGR